MIAKSIAAFLLIMAFLGGCVVVDYEEERRGGVSHRPKELSQPLAGC